MSSLTAKNITADWTGARTFTLTVTYTDGTKATAPATVTPLAVSVGYLTPANATVTAGTPTTFSATVTGGDLGTLTWSSGGVGSWSGSTWTAPGTAGSCTITATSVDDPSKNATTTVTVVAAPVATSLVASPAAPNQGATFTLTPTYSGGTGVLDNGVTCPATGVASGLLTASWAGARTYTLTVTNALGAVATRTVTVTPAPPFAIESFTSNTELVTYGGSAALSWVLSGPAPTALSLDGASVLGNLSAAVAPRNRQTFTLTGTSGNTDTKTLRVGAQGLDLLAGSPGGPGNADGTGSDARFAGPTGVAVDNAGNTYVADTTNQTIRKITSAGVVTTLAGLAGTTGTANGTGTAARFYSPLGVAVDPAGNVYVADTWNHAIRKITPEGVVSTLAGLAGSAGNANGTGSAARFNYPASVAVDASGNAYVAEWQSHTIRKITAAGDVSTLAGLVLTVGTADGTGTSARFNGPKGVASDATGNVYVADTGNHTIRMITPAGVVSTLAGQAAIPGTTDATGQAARFNSPQGVAVDAAGNVYVADYNNNAIRKVTPAGEVITLAGLAGTVGSAGGTGTAARFNNPQGVAVDPAGTNVYVAERGNNTIRRITISAGVGEVSTLAGLAGGSGSADGTGPSARFYNPYGLAVDGAGNTYVADTYNHTIRKVTPLGEVSTLAGPSAGGSGSTDGTGSAAQFYSPQAVAVDTAGNGYVADTLNHTIRTITPTGAVSTLAGLVRTLGSADGTGTAARFNSPAGVAMDAAGNAYVADTNNRTIRKITPLGEVSTLAGLAGNLGSADGMGAAARFSYPVGVFVDAGGYVYVTDQIDHTIRKITPLGEVSTLAGLAGTPGSADGTGTAARFNTPWGVAVDTAGNVYVADYGNHTIRKVTPGGVVTTVVGCAGVSGFLAGPLPGLLSRPHGVALTPDGDLVIIMANAVVQVTAP